MATYKTFRGVTVDVESIISQSENTKAVGNMGVNARGDKIDSKGNVVESSQQRTSRHIPSKTASGSLKKPITEDNLNSVIEKVAEKPKKTKKKEVLDSDGNIRYEDVPDAN